MQEDVQSLSSLCDIFILLDEGYMLNMRRERLVKEKMAWEILIFILICPTQDTTVNMLTPDQFLLLGIQRRVEEMEEEESWLSEA